MKKGGLKTIVSELQGASKMHLRQSKEIEKHIDDMSSPASRNGYNQVNVQDLQDMGAVKKDKKGKQYVVNERLTGTSKDTLNVGNHYSGRKYKTGELIDETDYENMSEKANQSPTSRISDTTNAYIDRKLKKADRKMSKINSSNSDRKNERKLSKANKSINQVNAKIEKRKLQDLRKKAPKSYGDNVLTTPVTNSPMNFKGANSSNSSCWKGYKKVGTKKSPSGTGETVNDCKKI